MLKFWKKPGSKEKQSASTPSSPLKSPKNIPKTNLETQQNLDIEEIKKLIDTTGVEVEKSRLSKTLDEVLNDTEALGYFIQYLEAIQNGALIKFWLDVVSFKASTCNISQNVQPASDCDNISCNSLNVDNTDWMSQILQSKCSNHIKDAVKIYQKYFSNNAIHRISLREELNEKIVNELNVPNFVSFDVYNYAKEYVYNILQNKHFDNFLNSEFHCKYQIDILTSSKVLISDIIYNETALFYFMEFLEQEDCRCLLEFWMSANNFHLQYKHNEQTNSSQVQDDAMVLYDKYFSLQATSPLHLGDKVRLEVEESICREDGPLPTCFVYTQRLIVKLLEVKYLQSFLSSQLYFKYLSELITTIQTNPILCPRRTFNSGGSDCSSEVSLSTVNTLLVSADVHPPRKMYWNQGSMSIDVRQLYDPDLLWQRGNNKSSLCFGRVNALGRFECDMEPEPDKKEGFRLSKAVKKLVNMDEDKSKEEMAWQVAAMIIKDVTTVTMSESSEE